MFWLNSATERKRETLNYLCVINGEFCRISGVHVGATHGRVVPEVRAQKRAHAGHAGHT